MREPALGLLAAYFSALAKPDADALDATSAGFAAAWEASSSALDSAYAAEKPLPDFTALSPVLDALHSFARSPPLAVLREAIFAPPLLQLAAVGGDALTSERLFDLAALFVARSVSDPQLLFGGLAGALFLPSDDLDGGLRAGDGDAALLSAVLRAALSRAATAADVAALGGYTVGVLKKLKLVDAASLLPSPVLTAATAAWEKRAGELHAAPPSPVDGWAALEGAPAAAARVGAAADGELLQSLECVAAAVLLATSCAASSPR